MAEVNRDIKMTVRLSEREEAIRDALEIDMGTDGNSVLRQGMLDLAKLRGVTPDLNKKKAVPEGAARRKR